MENPIPLAGAPLHRSGLEAIIDGMNSAIEIAMDGAGRLVVPKAIREAAGFEPGAPLHIRYRDGRIEIEPAPRPVRIVERDGLRVAEPLAPGPRLTAGTVRSTRNRVRDRSR